MKVVIAIDSFKGSLTSLEAGEAAKKGVLRVIDGEVHVKPLADGGEGTVDALVDGMNGIRQYVWVSGPSHRKVEAVYGIIEDNKTAVIEIAQAAGITLVTEDERNPFHTTTYGVGELIQDAIKKGCRNFIIGIGGSATNDGGIGMLCALGYEFLDGNHQPIKGTPLALSQIESINLDHCLKELKDCHFKIACDVNNPLCGPNGASAIFGPQKGATPDMVKQLDEGLLHFSDIVKKQLHIDHVNLAGAGAAGGLGYAFVTFLKGVLEPGIDIIIKETNLEDTIKDADFVITGEGRLDQQTAMGKGPMGVVKLGKKYGAVCIGLAGCISNTAPICNDHGMDAYFAVLDKPMTLEQAMDQKEAAKNMTNTTEQIFRLIHQCQQRS